LHPSLPPCCNEVLVLVAVATTDAVLLGLAVTVIIVKSGVIVGDAVGTAVVLGVTVAVTVVVGTTVLVGGSVAVTVGVCVTVRVGDEVAVNESVGVGGGGAVQSPSTEPRAMLPGLPSSGMLAASVYVAVSYTAI
jgi:hypothetical protein